MNTDLKVAGAIERHFVYQNVSFDFYLILENRKTVSATVFPTQALVVKAPLEASDDRIHDFLRRKFRWILRKQRYFAQFKAHPEKRYVSGETFRYRGRSHKLLIRKSAQAERVSLQHGTMTVFTALPEKHTRIRALIDAWYREKAQKVFAGQLSACLRLFDGSESPTLMIKRMARRWGSYAHKTNRVILNQELIKASTRYIDYVIIHELCHMTHKKHNSAFYRLLESNLPQWEKLKTELELSLLG